jgi:hypothetical protein
MQRREAVRLFREICKCIPESFVSSISLIPNNRLSEDFQLQINVFLEVQSLKSIQSLVEKQGLILKKDKGALLISGPEARPMEYKIFV